MNARAPRSVRRRAPARAAAAAPPPPAPAPVALRVEYSGREVEGVRDQVARYLGAMLGRPRPER